ncbi:hypothetical protein MLD38_000406 [Melastoma candidum]|uniref:Uncharacterized protein n=1 Tax=Melastoma candidum TaxID=119954 RepID=A0ACB9SA09_9MYRT|nr:hypothetical protein MLD38_000406 [Melastoma candidum]
MEAGYYHRLFSLAFSSYLCCWRKRARPAGWIATSKSLRSRLACTPIKGIKAIKGPRWGDVETDKDIVIHPLKNMMAEESSGEKEKLNASALHSNELCLGDDQITRGPLDRLCKIEIKTSARRFVNPPHFLATGGE